MCFHTLYMLIGQSAWMAKKCLQGGAGFVSISLWKQITRHRDAKKLIEIHMKSTYAM